VASYIFPTFSGGETGPLLFHGVTFSERFKYLTSNNEQISDVFTKNFG